MKKRILGLLLALCLVVGLLPVTALAANPQVNLQSAASSSALSGRWAVNAGTTAYYIVTDGKLTKTGADENNWAMKFEHPTEGTPTLTMKNLNMDGQIGLFYSANNYQMPTSDILSLGLNIVLIGENSIRTTYTPGLCFWTTGAITFSGEGSLVVDGNARCNTYPTANDANSGIICTFGDLVVDGAKVTVTLDEAYYTSHGISLMNGADVIVKDGGKLHIDAWDDPDTTESNSNGNTVHNSIGAIPGTDANNKSNVTVQDGGKLSIIHSGANAHQAAIVIDGVFTVKDADIEIANAGYTGSSSNTAYHILDADPVLNFAGAYTAVASTTKATYADDTDTITAPADTEDYANVTDITTLRYLKVTHTCTSAADDHDCTTAESCSICGKASGTAQTAHNLPQDDGDCTTAVKCQNAGCEYVSVEAKAAHTAGADDNDCTTAVKCANTGCTKDAVAAKPHTPADRADCSVAANCTVCGKEALAAGQHAGGTATCKAKAKCSSCGQEYGELAAHTPAADDGKCDTAIKCSVCGAETTAAKTHAYTDNTDASCNNAGCTHTRVVETPSAGTNGNPQGGDTMNLTLWISILAISVLGFVSVLVFSKKKSA